MSTTWIGEVPPGNLKVDDRAFEQVFSLRPDLYKPLCEFSGLFWHRRLVEPVALELCRLRVAQLLGNQSELATRTRTAVDAGLTEDHVGQLSAWPTAPVFTDAQQACIAFAEQFVIDPQGVDPEMRDAVSQTSSEPELVALAEALAVFDGFTRFSLLLCDDAQSDGPVRMIDLRPVRDEPLPLPDDADPAISASVLAQQPETLTAFLRLYGMLWSHGRLDHSIKEIARIRNARVTGCGYCRNVRFSVAREEGLTEERVSLVVDGFEDSDLSPREKIVVRYTDTFLREPGALTDSLRAELLEHFDAGEIVELTAGIALFMGFSKIAVTLGQAPEDMPTMVVPTPDWNLATI